MTLTDFLLTCSPLFGILLINEFIIFRVYGRFINRNETDIVQKELVGRMEMISSDIIGDFGNYNRHVQSIFPISGISILSKYTVSFEKYQRTVPRFSKLHYAIKKKCKELKN